MPRRFNSLRHFKFYLNFIDSRKQEENKRQEARAAAAAPALIRRDAYNNERGGNNGGMIAHVETVPIWNSVAGKTARFNRPIKRPIKVQAQTAFSSLSLRWLLAAGCFLSNLPRSLSLVHRETFSLRQARENPTILRGNICRYLVRSLFFLSPQISSRFFRVRETRVKK